MDEKNYERHNEIQKIVYFKNVYSTKLEKNLK